MNNWNLRNLGDFHVALTIENVGGSGVVSVFNTTVHQLNEMTRLGVETSRAVLLAHYEGAPELPAVAEIAPRLPDVVVLAWAAWCVDPMVAHLTPPEHIHPR